MFMQMPRHAVLGRHPYLEHHTAQTCDPTEGGATLLRNLLLNALEFASFLNDEQRATAFSGIIQLLGMPSPMTCGQADEMSWRVRSALAFIESQLSDRTLTADRISKVQGISRRRLDQIMTQSVGAPVTALIWIRRLTQAAADLLDPKSASRTVSEIAFAAGFEDPSSFHTCFPAPLSVRTERMAQESGALARSCGSRLLEVRRSAPSFRAHPTAVARGP